MSRLTASQQALVDADTNTLTHLIQLTYWNGSTEQTVEFCTAGMDIETSGLSGVPDATWSALGLPGGGSALSLSEAQETTGSGSQGLTLTLDGVDQTIIGIVLQNHFRGQPVRIWRAWIDPNTGQIEDHIEIWRGVQNDDYEIEEERSEEIGEEGTVTVTTRVVSFMALLQKTNTVVTSVASHNEMLARAGEPTGDTGFQTVPDLAGRPIYWGLPEPKSSGGSGGTTKGTGTGTGGGGGSDTGPGGGGDHEPHRLI